MTLAVIAAKSDNNVIGIDNHLPWHVPDDLKRFKLLTLGCPVIMGRKTFESIGKILPGRINIVLSRTPQCTHTFADLESALSALEQYPKVFVIGGRRVFEEALPLADELYITEIHGHYEGDVTFPDIGKDWIPIWTKCTDEYTFIDYVRC